ncbi:MAG TPA: hypothetical protein VN608_05545, partial [Clostridia bacterium]|nr:hypothetical protein [Clostridia bacterium]
MRKKLGYVLSERNIIINSQFAKEEFPQVFDFMLANRVLRQADYEAIGDKKLQNWLERRTIGLMLAESKKEWRPIMQNGELKYEVKRERDGKCQICGTWLKYLYFIQNTLNGAELCAGSECITQYGLDKKQLKEFKERVEIIQKIDRRQELIDKTDGALQ